MAGLRGRWMFSPTQPPPPQKSKIVFKWFYHFLFQSAVYESFISSISLSTLGIVNLFILAILGEYVVVSYCSFICISLMINDVKHLLMFSLVICIFSFINQIFSPFVVVVVFSNPPMSDCKDSYIFQV